MRHVLAATALLIIIDSLPAAAISPLPLAKPEIDTLAEIITLDGVEDAMDMTIDISIAEDDFKDRPSGLSLEPSAPNPDWDATSQSGVAFPIADGLSLGVDYEIEENEDLAANGISLSGTNDEHESHNVLLRANIQFDLTQ